MMTATKTERDLRQEWRTPGDLFALLHAEFGFDIDVAASVDNTKCSDFLDENADALDDLTRWFRGFNSRLSAFCNPPYTASNGGLRAWVWKAYSETQATPGATAVMLVNYDASTQWFMLARKLCTEIRVLSGKRVQFVPPLGIKPSSNSKGQALLIFRHKALGLDCIERSWDWTAAIEEMQSSEAERETTANG